MGLMGAIANSQKASVLKLQNGSVAPMLMDPKTAEKLIAKDARGFYGDYKYGFNRFNPAVFRLENNKPTRNAFNRLACKVTGNKFNTGIENSLEKIILIPVYDSYSTEYFFNKDNGERTIFLPTQIGILPSTRRRSFELLRDVLEQVVREVHHEIFPHADNPIYRTRSH